MEIWKSRDFSGGSVGTLWGQKRMSAGICDKTPTKKPFTGHHGP